MGHEIVVYRDRHAIIHDLDLWALRHFLLLEADKSHQLELAAFLRGWDWVGPGVYLGVNFDSHFDGNEGREQAFIELLRATRARIQSFGEKVPLDYLAANINSPGAHYLESQPTERWVQQIAKLQDLFTAGLPVG